MNRLGKCFSLLAVITPAACVSSQTVPPRHHYLVIDDRFIDKVENLTLVTGQPAPHEENPLLTMDTPVEGGKSAPWFNIILDPHEKFYKAWYGRDGCCYGTSHNGLLWNKPLLDLHPDAKGAKTSLLLKDFRGAGFLRDDPETIDARLFKLLGQGKGGVEARMSEDGIKFAAATPVKNLAFAAASHATVLRNSGGKGYVAFFAQETKTGRKAARQLVRTASDDFANWSSPEPLVGAAAGQSFLVLWHAGIYLALTGIDAQSTAGKLSLAASSDGARWTPHGPPSLPDPVQAVIPLRDEVRLYYTRGDTLNLATMRVDGFAGYSAQRDKAGFLITKPVSNPGMKLRLTADVGEGGSVTAVALDDRGEASGAPASLEKTSTNALMNLSLPADAKSLRFKFTLKNATLYAFSFGERTFP